MILFNRKYFTILLAVIPLLSYAETPVLKFQCRGWCELGNRMEVQLGESKEFDMSCEDRKAKISFTDCDREFCKVTAALLDLDDPTKEFLSFTKKIPRSWREFGSFADVLLGHAGLYPYDDRQDPGIVCHGHIVEREDSVGGEQ